MELTRDLASADVWADSLERSLARRGRPRRASLELGRLSPERDLADGDTVADSVVYWRTRRAAGASASFPAPAVGGASVLALLAATTLPSLASSAKSTPAGGARHTARATDTSPAAHTVVHRAAPKPVFHLPALSATVPSLAPSAPTATTVNTAAVTLDAAHPAAATRPVVYGTVTHGDLRDAQRLLGLAVDDVLGPKTGAAIRAFQASQGLTADGNIGPATWAALKAAHHAAVHAAAAATTPAAPAVIEASVRQSATTTSDTTDVAALQQALGIPADGTFGAATTTAVETYQTAHGMTADGVVGPTTRAALGLAAGPTLQQPTATGGTASPTTDPAATTAATTIAAATSTDSSAATTLGSTAATTDSTTSTSATPSSVTTALEEMASAGDAIATLPYIWGGGHGSWVSPGYDCSGSVSYVLHAAGLLSVPEDSGALMSYGAPGPGQYVTIYANAGHAWMTIEGRRFDTVALSEDGSRWSSGGGEFAGFVVRHPVGF
jgi:peptidoglycan hydrolase-like protein with peptidoglycan-binding domain